MNQDKYSGSGVTLDDALTAACEEAVKMWKPRFPDDMLTLEVEGINVLYGGIVGFTGTRVVTVRQPATMASMSDAGGGTVQLLLKLEVIPDLIYANLMPPVSRPQPRKVGMILTVFNAGSSDYKGQSPDSAVARFAVLRGRTPIWRFPEFASDVVTPVTIRAGESRTFTAAWEMADAVDFVDVDLTAVGRFVPCGGSAVHRIQVKAVY